MLFDGLIIDNYVFRCRCTSRVIQTKFSAKKKKYYIWETINLQVILGKKVFETSKRNNNVFSPVDWIVCNMLAIRQGSIGHLRYVMKDTLQALPLYGHYFYQHGCIYVKRGDFKQKKMESALDYLSNPNIKVSVLK